MKKLYFCIALLYPCLNFAQLNIMTVGKYKECPGEPDTLLAVGDTSFVWYLTDDPDSILSTDPMIVVQSESSYDPIYLSVATPSDTMDYEYWPRATYCFCDVYVPNRFTPDGDLFNEEFFAVINCGDIQGVRMTIVSRSGKVVFDETDYSAPRWNGRLNNEGHILKDDVYGWWISLVDEEGKTLRYNGFVALAK